MMIHGAVAPIAMSSTPAGQTKQCIAPELYAPILEKFNRKEYY
jgi:hypothetical protein